MRYAISRSLLRSLVYLLITTCTWIGTAHAEDTRLLKVRQGRHEGFTRYVLDCAGERPISRRVDPSGSYTVEYDQLTVDPDLKSVSRRLFGAVKQIDHYEKTTSRITLLFKTPGVRVKSFILSTGKKEDRTYSVVLDTYPPLKVAGAESKPVPVVPPMPAAPSPADPVVTAPVLTPPVADERIGASGQGTAPAVAQAAAAEAATDTDTEGSDIDDDDRTAALIYSGEASVIVRSVDGEDESFKFEEHRDISQSVSGDVAIDAVWDQRYFVKGRATGVGQEDQYAGIEAGEYGKYGIDFSYDQFIKRYAFDTKTLYSGVGSDRMTLDDNLQNLVQAAATPVQEATLLSGFLSSAATGNPEATRDRAKLGADLVALDPFNFSVELTHEKRQGTRPFAGAFNNSQMVELFEPIDYATIGMKISAEYAQAPYYVNVAYQYSQFENNNDTLLFDNPLSNNDTVAPSSGLIDLAPDNHYHNFSFTGAMTQLPGNSQVTANVAWGLMMQDDDLVPFTTNTAITAPALPADSADAQVNTQLYHLRLNSKPLPFMRVKGRLRYYDYNNETDQIDFSGGYVETDETLISSAITNLPTSYTKTLAGLDLGFDVFTRTSLGIGYQFERTERENREVDEQDDHIFKATADTRALDWLDLRTSYERTNREIGDYDFDVYLQSGDDIEELPQMRKYDQADMVRDRFQLQATVYPMDTLALGGSFTYGKDDFADSPYGLQDDTHFIVALDADYAVNDRASINLFFSQEKYDNSQKGRENGGGSDFDWTAEGEDTVTTVGGGLTVAIMPDQLDFKLSYAYSEVDGDISFSSPSGTFANFSAVDDTTLQVLDTKLKYHFNSRLSLAVGYLWESFDYEDYAAEGFSNVPTDAAGNYQGALLSGTLPEDYDAHVIYTQLTFRLP